jgi:pimeloyl-ACP methyl ester carboxylesterase
MQRKQFQRDTLRLSYLDGGGGGRPVVALHSHWMEGDSFRPLARALGEGFRVIALDQRGHGHSDHAASYTREDYLGDLDALFLHLGLACAILVGNSLGGVNAYQFAARHPEQVEALAILDIGAEVPARDVSFVLEWAGTFARKEDLVARIAPHLLSTVEPSFRQTSEGWTLAFEPRDMVASQHHTDGDHWDDWLASTCPAVVIRGRTSRLTTSEELQRMATRRPRTRFVELDVGHGVHVDDPVAVAAEVRRLVSSP